MSATSRHDRLLLYLAQPAEYVEGFAHTAYAVETSPDDDGAWWGNLTVLQPVPIIAGLQQDVGTRATVNFASEVPVADDALVRDTLTGRLYKVSQVNHIIRANAKIVSCEWREDSSYAIDSDVAAYTVVSVAVTPSPATVTVGPETTQRFTATALNAAGETVPGKTPTWVSSAPGVLMLAATGVGEGLAPGTATVTATVDGISGTAAVTVVAAV